MTTKGQRVANWLLEKNFVVTNIVCELQKMGDVEFDQLFNKFECNEYDCYNCVPFCECKCHVQNGLGMCQNTKFPHPERNSGCTPGTCDCDCHIQLGGCPCVCEDCAKNNSVQNRPEGEEK